MSRFEFDPYPTVAPTGAPQNDYEKIDAKPEMFGGLIAGAEEKLGKGVESVGEAGLGYLEARQHLNNEVHANDALTWFGEQGTKRTEEFRKLEGQAAGDGLDKFQSDMRNLRSQAMQDKSPQVQAQLSRGIASLMDRYNGIAATHAATQEREWHDRSAINTANFFGNQAALDAQHGTWDHVSQSLNTSDEAVGTLWRQRNPSLDPESKVVIDQEVKKNRGRNVKNIVETLAASGDPRTAQAVFDKYKDGMDAGSVLAVTSKLRSLNDTLYGHQVTDEETGRAPRGAPPAPISEIPATFVGAIKREEGFDAKPRWDVKQWTVGYGTRASGPDERPDHDELERRFQSEIGKAAKIVDGVNPNIDPGTRAALTSLTFNTGDTWTRAGLGEKVRAGDLAGAKQLFLQYGNVAGQPNAAVTERRWREAQWFGTADAPAGGGPAPDKSVIYNRIIARTADNPLAQAAAVGRMNQIFSVDRNERTQGLALFNRRVDDTMTEAYATGGVKQPVTEDEFVQHRPAGQSVDDARDRYQSYSADVRNSADRHAMDDMTSADMRAMVEAARPAPDSPGGMTRAAQRQAFLQKSMEEIEKKRRDDPAGAVRKSPAVTQALAQYDPQKPETYRSVADAQLAAQADLGIEPAYRSPITKDMALQLTAPIWHALPGQEKEAVQKATETFEKMFGRNWPEAFTYALGTHREDQAVKEAAANVIHRFLKGEPVGPTEARQADQQGEVAAAEGAVNAGAPRPPTLTPSPEAQFVAHAGGSRLSEEDIAKIEREADTRERQAREAQDVRETEAAPRQRALAEANLTFKSIPEPGTPERQAAMEQARRRHETERFRDDWDELARQEASLKSRSLPTPEARRAAGQRKPDIEAQLGHIQSRREVLIAAERERLGLKTAGTSSWPAGTALPPGKDIVALLHNPTLSSSFDKRYGPGAARRILGRGNEVAGGE
jgi:GH24 family phage-related lysozyme (muramidase)